ncbi:hypothetical protein [Arthrobacter sp. ISL-28]|uniref:hypothetical protein n=1 Tax=Arthrobacter sp. ISL-28 TaxID=2819108 RepID=UPI001BE981F0|nr:hypothetical protein [Arthrobacter sp. ISL-28]MBT2520737.1 hypothetical protein [Arthrobacter sp. ISL-28]
MSVMKKATTAVAGSLFLVGMAAGPSMAADNTTINDGLVNVTVGDVTILEDVNVAVAADVTAQICGVDLGPVAVLGEAVDATGTKSVVCLDNDGPIAVTQN